MIELPRVMREIIRDLLSAEPGVALVGETSGDVDISELVHATRADVVVMGLPGIGLPAFGQRLLAQNPGLRLLGVVGDGRDAVMYELRPRQRLLGEVSPTALVSAIRGVRVRQRVAYPD